MTISSGMIAAGSVSAGKWASYSARSKAARLRRIKRAPKPTTPVRSVRRAAWRAMRAKLSARTPMPAGGGTHTVRARMWRQQWIKRGVL